MTKLSMLLALLNLNVYQLYLNKLAMEAGEETAADRIYDFTGIDIGFRSVTLGKKPKCDEEGEKIPEWIVMTLIELSLPYLNMF